MCLFWQSCISCTVSRWLVPLRTRWDALASVRNGDDAATPFRQGPPLLSCEGQLPTACHSPQGAHSPRLRAPQSHRRVIPSAENGSSLRHLIQKNNSDECSRNVTVQISHMCFISDWLFRILGKSHGYLQEPELPISRSGRFTERGKCCSDQLSGFGSDYAKKPRILGMNYVPARNYVGERWSSESGWVESHNSLLFRCCCTFQTCVALPSCISENNHRFDVVNFMNSNKNVPSPDLKTQTGWAGA